MVLANYVKLVPEVEKVLRIKEGSFRIEDRSITDPKTQLPKMAKAAVVVVYEEDGVPVDKTYSTLADKHAATLHAMHLNGDLYRYRIGITKTGVGFRTEYRVRTL